MKRRDQKGPKSFPRYTSLCMLVPPFLCLCMCVYAHIFTQRRKAYVCPVPIWLLKLTLG